jgi:hypothetical protein
METYKNALEAQLGREADALLLLPDDEAPEELETVADVIGVQILGGFQDDRSTLEKLLTDLLPDSVRAAGINTVVASDEPSAGEPEPDA